MKIVTHAAADVINALTGRLSSLEADRTSIALRVRELEGELATAQAEAELRASESVQIEALIAFYRSTAQVDSSDLPDQADGAVETPQPSDAAAPKATARRASPQWTVAWRDEAIAVLKDHGDALHYRELYRAISARGFTFGGKSPEATFLASLSRDQATFKGVGRGSYWLVGQPSATATAVPGPNRRARRPKPIGTQGRR